MWNGNKSFPLFFENSHDFTEDMFQVFNVFKNASAMDLINRVIRKIRPGKSNVFDLKNMDAPLSRILF